jgi:thiol-disulfide isomerase/thioredoxin
MRIPLIAALAGVVLFGIQTLPATTAKSNIGEALPALRVDYVGAKPDVAGKPLIVEFWATWCGPCRTSIPHLNEIHKKYKDRGLVIVGVTDEDNATIRKFTKTVPMDYFPGTDKGKLSEKLGVEGIPHAVLVDKSGKIVWEGHPMQLKDDKIEEVLK